MATFHRMRDESGADVVRCFVKGAPDVLLARSSSYLAADGSSQPMGDAASRVLAENDRLAGAGLRVLAVARRDFDVAPVDPRVPRVRPPAGAAHLDAGEGHWPDVSAPVSARLRALRTSPPTARRPARSGSSAR